MTVSGLALNGMGMGHKHGLMMLDMRGNGKTIKLMEKGSSGMLMEIYSMVSGLMTRPMVKVYIFM